MSPTAAPPLTRPAPGLRGLALDLRSLQWFRVGLGGLLLATYLLHLPDLATFYTDRGVLPREVLRALRPNPSLHALSGSYGWQLTLALLGIAAAVSLAAGYRPRLSAALSWVLLASLLMRNPVIVYGADRLLWALTLWAILLPLDQPRGRYQSPIAAAFVLQVCAVYWSAVAAKSGPAWTTDFSAVYYALHADFLAAPLGAVIRDHYPLTQALTVGTLGLEAMGPMLALISRTRKLAVVLMVGFHLGMGLAMRLGTFPWVCAVMWLALWPRDEEPANLHESPIRQLAAFTGLAVVVWSLVAPGAGRGVLGVLAYTGLVQEWRMFAPEPGNEDGWFLITGARNGEPVSVWGSTETRPDYATAWRSTRWVSTLMSARIDEIAEILRPPLARYFCGGLDSLTITFMRERTSPPGAPSIAVEREVVWQGACP